MVEKDDEIWELRGKMVNLQLDSGEKNVKNEIIGTFLTRDPISLAVLIGRIQNDEISVEWIPNCSIQSIKPLEEGKGEEKNKKIEEIFKKWINESKNEEKEGEEDFRARGLKVVNYLKSHHLDVTENSKNGVFLIAGSVSFEPPYRPDNMFCDIPIVLKRILKLIEEI